jgi:PPK2 family polyphosphate:nucleotide phosphotransferase
MAKALAPVVIDGKLNGKKKFQLSEVDPSDTGGWKKPAAVKQLEVLGAELAELTNLLAYAGEESLLVVIQGRDASGKDGLVRKILNFANVLNTEVHAFKAPNEEERGHDFLWRIHKATPRQGQMALFNRSHYEDIVAVRVHQLAPAEVWKPRHENINGFERFLTNEKTLVLKFFLDVSKEEQIERLLEREHDPRTAWKLNVNDWREIPLWDKTTEAYEDVFRRCSPAHAPWYIVPADHKWIRNLAVFERILLTLRPFRDQWHRKLELLRDRTLPEIEALRRRLAVKRRIAR